MNRHPLEKEDSMTRLLTLTYVTASGTVACKRFLEVPL